jgi:hypothetical protein
VYAVDHWKHSTYRAFPYSACLSRDYTGSAGSVPHSVEAPENLLYARSETHIRKECGKRGTGAPSSPTASTLTPLAFTALPVLHPLVATTCTLLPTYAKYATFSYLTIQQPQASAHSLSHRLPADMQGSLCEARQSKKVHPILDM